jgi:hypothetical protein
MVRSVGGVIVMAAVFAIGGAQAQTVDMTGTWKSVGEGIVSGASTHHPPGASAKAAGNHRLRNENYTFVVEGQEGKRFWGHSSSVHAAKVPFVGSLSFDGKWIYTASASGLADGAVIDNDTIQVCYRRANPQTFLVSCDEWKRQK